MKGSIRDILGTILVAQDVVTWRKQLIISFLHVLQLCIWFLHVLQLCSDGSSQRFHKPQWFFLHKIYYTKINCLFSRATIGGNMEESTRVFPWLIWYIWKAQNEKLYNDREFSPVDTTYLGYGNVMHGFWPTKKLI